MRATPSVEERQARRREYNREYQRKYRADPKNRKRAYKMINASIRRRYSRDAKFREYISNYNRAWREKNKAYDTLRKTIAAINACGDEEKKKMTNKLQRARIQSMTPGEFEDYRKRQSKAQHDWYYRQVNDPEIGELFRMTLRPVSQFFTQEMKNAAVAKYRAIMERRKEERRARRLEGLFVRVNG